MFIIVSALFSQAFAGTVASCDGVKYVTNIDETGNVTFEDYALKTSVYTKSGTNYGYEATTTYADLTTDVESDVKFSYLKKEDALEFYNDLEADLFYPVDLSQVDSGSYANIGVKINRDDALGLGLLILHNKKKQIIGKIIRIGWGVGYCKN